MLACAEPPIGGRAEGLGGGREARSLHVREQFLGPGGRIRGVMRRMRPQISREWTFLSDGVPDEFQGAVPNLASLVPGVNHFSFLPKRRNPRGAVRPLFEEHVGEVVAFIQWEREPIEATCYRFFLCVLRNKDLALPIQNLPKATCEVARGLEGWVDRRFVLKGVTRGICMHAAAEIVREDVMVESTAEGLCAGRT